MSGLAKNHIMQRMQKILDMQQSGVPAGLRLVKRSDLAELMEEYDKMLVMVEMLNQRSAMANEFYRAYKEVFGEIYQPIRIRGVVKEGEIAPTIEGILASAELLERTENRALKRMAAIASISSR